MNYVKSLFRWALFAMIYNTRALHSLPFLFLFICYCTLITTYTGCFIDIIMFCPQPTRWATRSRCLAGTDSPWSTTQRTSTPFPFHFVFSFCCTLITSYTWSFIDKCFVHSQNDELREVAVSLGPIRHDLQHKERTTPSSTPSFIPCHHLLYLRMVSYVPVLSTANTMSYVKSLFRWDRFAMIYNTQDLPLPLLFLGTIYCT